MISKYLSGNLQNRWWLALEWMNVWLQFARIPMFLRIFEIIPQEVQQEEVDWSDGIGISSSSTINTCHLFRVHFPMRPTKLNINMKLKMYQKRFEIMILAEKWLAQYVLSKWMRPYSVHFCHDYLCRILNCWCCYSFSTNSVKPIDFYLKQVSVFS